MPAASTPRGLSAGGARRSRLSRGPRLDPPVAGSQLLDGVREVPGPELGAVVAGHLPQAPAGGLQLPGHPMDELAGEARARILGGGVQLGPGEARGHVRRGVLPDRALGPREPAEVEAVELDLLTGLRGVDVALWRGLGRPALVGVAVAGDQGQPARAGVQTKALQDPPDPVL